MFSSRIPDNLMNDPDYVTEYIPQQARAPETGRETVELVIEPKMTHPELQPTNASPIIDSHIRHMPAQLNSPLRIRRRQVTELKRLAAIKYEKAVKSFNSEYDTDVYRYQLQAAKPKNENFNDTYISMKKMYEQATTKAPQLQPKNIKPYGNMDTPNWIGPNVENFKQSIVLQDLRRNKLESIIEKRKRSSATELQSGSSKVSLSHTQQRDYCTIPEKKALTSPPLSPELEKCRAIIAEYKNLNPAYTGKTTKIVPGSVEEKKILEEAEKLVAAIKNNNKSYGMTTTEPKTTANSESLKTAPIVNDSMKQQQTDNQKSPALHLPQASDTKVILFYDDKKRKLCSKVVKTSSNNQSSVDQDDVESASKIKIKVGPKLMLQSSDLNDRVYRTEELKPAPNEKFISPWLSWSDRVKMHSKVNLASVETPVKNEGNIIQKTSTAKLTASAGTVNTTTEGTRGQEIQKRQYSWRSTLQDFNTVRKTFLREPKIFNDGEKFHKTMKWTDVWNKCNGNLRSDELFHKCSSEGAIRPFTTECTRGVLGPEATVMVKLRRLPKINIPEPEKECEKIKEEPCYRADGEIRVAQKKLPKLVVQPCAVPTKRKMKISDPIPRPKMRYVPKEAPKVCLQKVECKSTRADDGMVVSQKKLPKLKTRDCFPTIEQKMTSPPLPRLVPRPVPPPPPCPDLEKDQCPPRADEGLKITRKKLPSLSLPDCDRYCPPEMTEGEPLKRLKRVHIPDPKRTCEDVEDLCPPRADETTGYKVKKKKLHSLILGEKYNEISWKEFNSKRNFASDSKCSMCCFSDKKVQPDIKVEKEDDPSEWSKFKGRLLCEENGKLFAYLPPEEKIDTSTGSELKILKKPIGTSFRRDEHLHEELLKGGFTNLNTSDRKFFSSSTEDPCFVPPDRTPYKDLRLKRLKKRKGFDEDFPGRLRFQKHEIEKECIDECALMVRMDDAMKYEVKQKKLPRLPEGGCARLPRRIPKAAKSLLRRPIKKQRFRSYDCPKEECVDHCPPRADANYVARYNKLIPMHEISKTCQPPPPVLRDEKGGIKPLPKVIIDEPIRCKPPPPCDERTPRADHRAVLYKRKSLPLLQPVTCPRPPPRKMKPAPKMRRLPQPPHYEDRMRRGLPECEPPDCYISDEINNYQVKPKKLKSLLKSNNRAFSTLPTEFLYKQNFHMFESNRYFSSTQHLFSSDKRECKKLAQQQVTKKCPKVNLTDCKPAKSISCARRVTPRLPCTKQKSPYPAFSECQDHQRPDIITECRESEKMLQPRWPILSEIKSQKPPPPYQGKIDPSKQEECIARKLNIVRDGITKTCETFDDPDKPVLTKEMYDEVMRNPPYDECECANEGQDTCASKKDDDKGPCKPKDLSVCKDPEIECILNDKKPDGIACVKTEDESEEASMPHGKVIGKLTCQKKGADEECDEDGQEESKEASKPVIAKQSAKEDCTEKAAKQAQKAKPSSASKKPCEKVPSDCKESAAKKTKTSASKTKCDDEKGAEKKSHCRNTKSCSKDGKKKTKVKKVRTKRRTPKKCSDILKEEDKKAKKKTPTGKKKPQMAALCKKKPCVPKDCKSKSAVKKAAVKPPAKKSLWQRIKDYFKARPNCPAPDQWKKDKLRKQAEKAAAAAGLELCEKKKPKEVKVSCKKTGIRRAGPNKKTDCKKIPISCSGGKAKPKKKTSKPEASNKCKTIKQECSQSKGSDKKVKTASTEKKPPKKSPCDGGGKGKEECKPKIECKPKTESKSKTETKAKTECKSDKSKTSQKTRSSEKVEGRCAPDEAVEEECEEEEEEETPARPGSKCKVLPKQKFCEPRARYSCREDMRPKGQCTPQESPYACYSDCKKEFPKIPITECTEQEKNLKRKTVTYDYDDPSKQQTKKYHTLAFQKRYYSSGSNGWKDYDPLSLLEYTTEDPLNNIDNNELALKILAVLKEGIKNMEKSQSVKMNRNCVDIFKELELLCEQELNKNLAKEPTSKSKFLSGVNFDRKSPILNQTNFIDMEQQVMAEAVKNFCKTMFLMPDSSTEEYEEAGTVLQYCTIS